MTNRRSGYFSVIVESYHPNSTGGLHGPIHIRPVAGQGLDISMHVECSKSLSYSYPVGTRFRLRAKITNKEGGRPFLYSYFGWPYEVISD